MKTNFSTRAMLATAALVALVGTASILTTEAAPVADLSVGAVVEPSLDYLQLDESQDIVSIYFDQGRRLQKRQAPKPTPTTREEHETTTARQVPPKTEAPQPTKTNAPNPPNPPNPNTRTAIRTTTTEARRTTAASGTATSGGSSGGAIIPTSTSGTAPGASPTNGNNDNGVPTSVSSKVFIGLGTVGGFFIFALGGLAFCRHRKKKNLASALLQQTAQFNNNNPYAKLPEPAASPKESLPMTPTKPLGNYTVVAEYTPALADEVEMRMGDSVTILQEFDDGWCSGINNTRGGLKGVFPRHCVEMGPYEGSQHGAPGGPHFPPSPSFKATKRISSIPAGGGWNDNSGYNNGFQNQPSPQHLGPNQGPPQQGGYYNNGY